METATYIDVLASRFTSALFPMPFGPMAEPQEKSARKRKRVI